jgi:hypothetical protein
VFHEPLLDGTKVKSLAPGAGVSMSSTSDLVTISAAPISAPGGTGTFSLVDESGQILRLRPGSGAYASNQSGAVEPGVVTQGAQFQAPLSVLDANGTALRARFAETRAEFFTDTTVNGGLTVTGLSQFQGVEASGVVAEQVVWVTGDGAAQSIMFPGSLQLGKWRLRGTDSGQAILEWFAEEYGAWRQVTAFTQDATVGLETGGGRADTLLIGPDELGIGAGAGLAGWVDGKLRATDDLEAAARLRTDTVEPFAGAAVRVASNLAVDGSLQAVEPVTVVCTPATGTGPPSHLFAGTLVLGKWRIRGDVGGEFYLERLDDDGAERADDWYKVCTWGFNTEINSPGMDVDNLSVSGNTTLQNVSAASLTVGGVNVAGALAASEPVFTAVAPLQKAINLQTGQLELRVDTAGLGGNPFWAAGKVASNGTVLTSSGRVWFSVANTGRGQYTVTFATPHPTADNIVTATSHGYVYLSYANETGFGLVLKNYALNLANAALHFTVLA